MLSDTFIHQEFSSSEWVSDLVWRPFWEQADIEVHIVHTSRVIIAYTSESLSSLT